MNWDEVCQDPSLQDLPYHIELDGEGNIVMSPVKMRHSAYSEAIQDLLKASELKGHCPMECAIVTADGVRVPDVVWVSKKRFKTMITEEVATIAPEICVEVLSPGQTVQSMIRKAVLYLEAGAQEVWVCDQEGNMHFITKQGMQDQSNLFPDFSKLIVIDLD